MKKIILILLSLLLIFNIPVYGAVTNDEEKIVYLTFDDGPGGKTNEEILDILKKENVKATFFIIGKQVKGQENILLRMKEEGHSIGLHSFTHDRNNLYPNPDGFINEMLKCQDAIKEATGDTPTILRFPFGCNNSTYRLKKNMVDAVHSHNFKIYDWTVDTRDGDNYGVDPSVLVQRSNSKENTVVLLMHCTVNNTSTAKALPSIIKIYKDKGYTFKAIDDTTPEIFRLNEKN